MFQAKFQIAGNILEPPFLDVAKMALLWQKDGPHIVLRICSSSILINLLRDVLCQISHCWVYPVTPLLEMAKIWSGWFISGLLVQYLHFIRIILFVLQSASWLTSLLKLGKYRDVSCPGWDIFFKYFGHLPGMFFTLFLKIKILLYVCLSVSWLTSLLKLGQYRDISSSRRVILLFFWRYSLNVFTLF